MEGLFNASIAVMLPNTIFFLVGGTVLGVILGAIPGVTGAMGIALLLPMTFYMTANNALTMMVSMYVGAIAGGLVTAILLRIPGEPSSIVTTFDGNPMARKGQPGRALGYAVGAALFGGLVSWVALVALTYPLSEVAAALRPFDILALVLMALVLIAALGQGSIIKGLIAGLLGILVSMPGTDPSTGALRLTFGIHDLDGGFSTLSVLIGAYAVAQVLSDIIEVERKVETVPTTAGSMWITLREWKEQRWNLIRSSLIGTWVGIMPGIGATVGSLLSYTVAKTMSKTPEKFGTGHPEGIVASECGNNSTVGGALIPDDRDGHPRQRHGRLSPGGPGDPRTATGSDAVHQSPGDRLHHFRRLPDLPFRPVRRDDGRHSLSGEADHGAGVVPVPYHPAVLRDRGLCGEQSRLRRVRDARIRRRRFRHGQDGVLAGGLRHRFRSRPDHREGASGPGLRCPTAPTSISSCIPCRRSASFWRRVIFVWSLVSQHRINKRAQQTVFETD